MDVLNVVMLQAAPRQNCSVTNAHATEYLGGPGDWQIHRCYGERYFDRFDDPELHSHINHVIEQWRWISITIAIGRTAHVFVLVKGFSPSNPRVYVIDSYQDVAGPRMRQCCCTNFLARLSGLEADDRSTVWNSMWGCKETSVRGKCLIYCQHLEVKKSMRIAAAQLRPPSYV